MLNSQKIALNDNQWLRALPETARSELISAARVRQFAANERVQGKGEAADGLYGLLNGEVRISATSFSGDEIVFTRLLQGHWFGEIAILDGGLRTHDAHTVVSSEIAILPRQALLNTCQRSPETYRAMVLLLCEHCRMAFTAIDEFLIYTPEQRMAQRLLARLPGDGDGKVLLSQSELGALVGVSRQTTNKILRRWESQSLINRVYGGVEILDVDNLQNLADV